MVNFDHTTVLLKEAINQLDVKENGKYVDCTLGGGGHSQEILKQLSNGHLYSFDQDDTAIKYNQKHLEKFIKKITWLLLYMIILEIFLRH